MAQIVGGIVGVEDRARPSAILGDRNRPLKQVQRASNVLLSAERLEVMEVARRAGVRRPAMWRWQQRSAKPGAGGLLRDKTRLRSRTPRTRGMVAKMLAPTCAEPSGAVTY